MELLWPLGATVDAPQGRGVVQGYIPQLGFVLVQQEGTFGHHSVRMEDLTSVVKEI